MGSRGHTANPQRNPLWFLLNIGTVSAQQMLKLQMAGSWERCRRKYCTHFSVFLVPHQGVPRWVRLVACSHYNLPDGPCSQPSHPSGCGPKVWMPLKVTPLNLCVGINHLVGRNIWSPFGHPTIFGRAQVRLGCSGLAPVPASHAPPSEFFFIYSWSELVHLSLGCSSFCVFTVFAFLRTRLLLSVVSGSFQKVLQPPDGLWLPSCGHWVPPEQGLNKSGCRRSGAAGAVGAVPWQVGGAHLARGDGDAHEGVGELRWSGGGVGIPFQA